MAFSRSRLLVAFLSVSALAAVAILRWVRVERETPPEIVAQPEPEVESRGVRVPIGTRSAPAKRVEIDNRLTGRVVSADGSALAECAVSLSTWGASAWGRVGERDPSRELVTRTDPDGRYVFEDVAPRGAYRLFFERAEHESISRLTSSISERGTFEQAAVVLAAPAPVDESVTAAAAAAEDAARQAPPREPVSVRGRVVIAGGREPLDAFDVRLLEGPDADSLVAVEAPAQHVTDASGAFGVTSVLAKHGDAPWFGRIEINAPGAGLGRSPAFVLTAGMHVDDVLVEVRPGGVLHGRVVDRHGAPVAGTVVRVVEAGTAGLWGFFDDFMLEENGWCRALAASGADGRYELRDVPAGTHDICFDSTSHAAHWREEIALTGTESVEIGDDVLLRGASVRVRAVDERGEFVDRACVSPTNDVGAFSVGLGSDGSGVFRFDRVRPGSIRVRAITLDALTSDWLAPTGAEFFVQDEREIVVDVPCER